MTNKISEIFGVKLSRKGKDLINEWLIEEYETIYYAKKQLVDDESIREFILDMLEQNNMGINDLTTEVKQMKHQKYSRTSADDIKELKEYIRKLEIENELMKSLLKGGN